MSHGFDLEGVGLTIDDLDLDLDDSDLTRLPLDRPRYRPKGWWTPTPSEEFYLDLPDFRDGAERVRFMMKLMARAGGAGDDEPVIPYMGGMVSLNELLVTLDTEAVVRLDELR